MKIKDITLESRIQTYLHDHSKGGVKRWVSLKKMDTYPNPMKELQVIVDHHYSWVRVLNKAGEICGRPFAMPKAMIPGKTSHFCADLTMTVCYSVGRHEELWLDEPSTRNIDRYEANKLLSSIGHPTLLFP